MDAAAAALRLLASGDAALWQTILRSLAIAAAALATAAPPALLTAYLLATRRFPGRRAVLAILHGFLSFPTVVIGLLLYLLLSRSGPLGTLHLLFTPQAMAIGQSLIAYPVLAVFAHAALQKDHLRIAETARSLGAGPSRAMLTAFSEARAALAAALLAGFGRVISEVGCALIVGGNIAHHTRTIPTAIALDTGKGAFAESIALGLILVLIAVAVSAVLAALQDSSP